MIPTIVLMVKAPRRGQVKTRLAAEIGDAAALAAYRWLGERTARSWPAGWPVEVHFSPAEPGAEAETRAWLGARTRYVAQLEADDLGERLVAAAEGALTRGAEAVLLIGADCPELDTEVLRAAATALDRHDAVLGPARDGGYYLLGVKRGERRLFEGVPWSTAAVAEATRARLRAVGWSWAELPELEDVDDAATWARARRRHGFDA